ncbi:30S ribosomal protein S15, putative [Theileria annulata]|uniref:30S ribosomal protein S15, putative n=1 Tax=Theileria annulata TaxID=5874 RepID=Q4U938_THEAN|nr:30S ribosomal protein S15, putative [Theileria annulata]CAI76665.1 30S ribosomal protein S15, putative [Theileria annulata]|eukprot:XP_953290.1 30S ribosomal protein S15, putative [Theileria annulata]
MLFSSYRIYVFSLVLVLIYNCRVEPFKIRYGREKSRIEKLKKRKGAILDKLNSYIRTRGYGLLPLKALPHDSIANLQKEDKLETFINPSIDDTLYSLTSEAIRRKKTKNPIVPVDFEKFNPLFRKISALRTYKSNIDYENRPGKLDPDNYRIDFVELDTWDIHPRRIRVKGKYFSKLYEYELKEPMKRHEFDTGSPEVVVAALTAKIDYLTHHLDNNRRDIQAKRQITKLGYKRRKLLKYLYRTRRETYDLLTDTFDIHFEDDFCPIKKIIKKNTHLYHTKTKRYHTAKERKEDLYRYKFVI